MARPDDPHEIAPPSWDDVIVPPPDDLPLPHEASASRWSRPLPAPLREETWCLVERRCPRVHGQWFGDARYGPVRRARQMLPAQETDSDGAQERRASKLLAPRGALGRLALAAGGAAGLAHVVVVFPTDPKLDLHREFPVQAEALLKRTLPQGLYYWHVGLGECGSYHAHVVLPARDTETVRELRGEGYDVRVTPVKNAAHLHEIGKYLCRPVVEALAGLGRDKRGRHAAEDYDRDERFLRRCLAFEDRLVAQARQPFGKGLRRRPLPRKSGYVGRARGNTGTRRNRRATVALREGALHARQATPVCNRRAKRPEKRTLPRAARRPWRVHQLHRTPFRADRPCSANSPP